MDMSIRIKQDEQWGYSVYINGEVILECLADDELKSVTMQELIEFAMEENLI